MADLVERGSLALTDCAEVQHMQQQDSPVEHRHGLDQQCRFGGACTDCNRQGGLERGFDLVQHSLLEDAPRDTCQRSLLASNIDTILYFGSYLYMVVFNKDVEGDPSFWPRIRSKRVG